jgi:DNA-directed RNA polymerase subunit RPC12/RpoP
MRCKIASYNRNTKNVFPVFLFLLIYFFTRAFYVIYLMEFLQLRSFDNYINASLTLARLDEEGITCYLKDEYTVTIDPFLSNAVGGIKIMVLPDDFEKAKALLTGYDKDYRENITCPECGSHNVEYIIKSGVKNWLTAVVSWWISSYAMAAEHVYHCYNCSFEFKDLPESALHVDNV